MAKKNNELPYMPVHVADAIADAEGLTNEELGALTRIRWSLWKAGGMLPEARLSRYARAGKRWGAVSRTLLERLEVAGGKASDPLLMAVLVLTRERRRQRVEAGTKSASTRTSEGALNSTSGGLLNRRKPLKTHDVTPVLVDSSLQRESSNQNQNSKITPSFSTAARDVKLRGTAIVARCMAVPRPTAERHVTGWIKAMQDEESLLEILETHDQARHRGHTFTRMVTEAVNRVTSSRIRGGVQRDLPLPPVAIGGRK